jgi:hypothetical protein
MTTCYSLKSNRLTYLFFVISIFSIDAQQDTKIESAYNAYTEAPKEVAYLHLNKLTYIYEEQYISIN